VKLRVSGLLVFLSAALTNTASARPVHLRCEYLQNPLGIDQRSPRLSWQSDNAERNWQQLAYQILVASSAEQLRSGKADVWDTGKTESADSVGIAYAGPKLESRRRYYWQVRVWDTRGRVYESSEAAWWEMGLLSPDDWKAQWISWKDPQSDADRIGIRWIWMAGKDALQVAPKTTAVFRDVVSLSEKPREAALFIAVRGNYVARVNGHEVSRKKGWITFDRQDITGSLVAGENSVEIAVTAGTPSSFGPYAGAKVVPAALGALVRVSHFDGSVLRFPTNERWQGRLASQSIWQTTNVVGDLSDKRLGDPGPMPQSASELRREFELPQGAQHARLYVTALGSYRAYLNGNRVGADVLTPEFTDYRKRVLYQIYDVSHLLAEGRNVIGVTLADGWYGSGLTWIGMHFFPPPNRFLAQLEVDFADGRRETIVTDASWKGAASPIVHSEIYSGETYDARLEQKGWDKAGFDDSQWTAVYIAESPEIAVSSQINIPAQVVMQLRPERVAQPLKGTYVFDMGQNMVGWASLRVNGPSGTRVRLRFAEILNPDGTIYTKNLRNADATDIYVLKGGGEERFSPEFTFHGFRYVEVTGYPGIPATDALTGEVVSSLPGDAIGKLTTSSDLINKMWSIGIWGQRGNFLSVPTDCPQRDERLGWMGDAGVFWRTGSYNFDIAAFSQKFMQDVMDAQTPQGAFTNVSPDTLPFGGSDSDMTPARREGLVGAPGWGDAGVIVPWTTWMQYGNKDIIERNWEAMRRWMEFIHTRNPDFLRKAGVGPNFADWLAPDEHTDKELLATAYWALIANMMVDMARATGKDADAKHYSELVANIRAAFQKAYIKENGEVGTGTQTSYVVALYTKMAPENLEPLLVDRLVRDIESRKWHLSTGFLGTPFLLFTLADHGRTDVAYRLLLNETYPSWGYMLSKGATTWWERWNGDTGDPAMNSYNHYAFGSVIAWVYRYMAGIDTDLSTPGFKKIIVHPHLDPQVSFAKGEYDSIYGKIVADWKGSARGSFTLSLTIPANTTAEVFLPAAAHAEVIESGKKVAAQRVGDSLMVSVGSGSYAFEVK
jgi:alpha-L-rhamnosidase